ncbi:SDR family oxidoreductase [Paraburkholderia sp. NPDC080076]|uniref:SDR family oxidoreductase n=1 Tax=Paraburkholderia sp. NPDC080076 TaxID=3390605 RepID=UPI003D03AB47
MSGAAKKPSGRFLRRAVFNNAGIAPGHKPLHDISAAEWHRVVDVDLTGAFLCMKHEIAAMLQSGGAGVRPFSPSFAQATATSNLLIRERAHSGGCTPLNT